MLRASMVSMVPQVSMMLKGIPDEIGTARQRSRFINKGIFFARDAQKRAVYENDRHTDFRFSS